MGVSVVHGLRAVVRGQVRGSRVLTGRRAHATPLAQGLLRAIGGVQVVMVPQDAARLARLSHGHVEDARVVLVPHCRLGRAGGWQGCHLGGRGFVGGGGLGDRGYIRDAGQLVAGPPCAATTADHAGVGRGWGLAVLMEPKGREKEGD